LVERFLGSFGNGRDFCGAISLDAFEVQSGHFSSIVFERIDLDGVFPFEASSEEFLGEWVFDALLDRSAQWTGTVVEIRTLFDDEFFGFIGQFNFESSFTQTLSDLRQFEVDDQLEVFVVQVSEDDYVIETV
jgi:hypothetical protein